MAESTLSLTYTQLVALVARYLSLLPVSSLSATDTTLIDDIIASGLRQFYFPPPVNNERPHEWSFLKPVVTLDTIAPYSTGTLSIGQYATGTVTVASGDCTLLGGIWPSWVAAGDTLTIGGTVYAVTTRDDDTGLTVVGDDVAVATAYTIVTDDATNAKAVLAGGTWPSWADTHGSIVIDNTEYVISTRDSDTELTLAEAFASADYIEGDDYTLKHDGDYDLPDDFAALEGDIVVESENFQSNIIMVGEGRIRSMRQHRPQNENTSAHPHYAAIRPKEHTVTTTGQRFEIMFFPLPSSVETLSYVKVILPEKLVTTTIEYPYGGAKHSETIRAGCIAAAEESENGNRLNGNPVYDKKKLFQERLAASIHMDKQTNSIKYFGYNGDSSDIIHREGRRGGHHRYRTSNRGIVQYNP